MVMVQRAKGHAAQAAPMTNGQAQEYPDDGLSLPHEINKEIFDRSCATITERGGKCRSLCSRERSLPILGAEEGRAKGAPHQSVLVAYDPPGTDLNIQLLRSRGLDGEFWDRRAHTTNAGPSSTCRSLSGPDRACRRAAVGELSGIETILVGYYTSVVMTDKQERTR
jgi:hypothetical protein